MNPNNCETCDYRHTRGPDCSVTQHCYMFQDSPNEQCMQHTGHKQADLKLTDLLRGLTARKDPL